MSDAKGASSDVPCERCETRHLPDASCAPLQLCPVCGRNGGGIPCGHYYDEISLGIEAGNLMGADEW